MEWDLLCFPVFVLIQKTSFNINLRNFENSPIFCCLFAFVRSFSFNLQATTLHCVKNVWILYIHKTFSKITITSRSFICRIEKRFSSDPELLWEEGKGDARRCGVNHPLDDVVLTTCSQCLLNWCFSQQCKEILNCWGLKIFSWGVVGATCILRSDCESDVSWTSLSVSFLYAQYYWYFCDPCLYNIQILPIPQRIYLHNSSGKY